MNCTYIFLSYKSGKWLPKMPTEYKISTTQVKNERFQGHPVSSAVSLNLLLTLLYGNGPLTENLRSIALSLHTLFVAIEWPTTGNKWDRPTIQSSC